MKRRRGISERERLIVVAVLGFIIGIVLVGFVAIIYVRTVGL